MKNLTLFGFVSFGLLVAYAVYLRDFMAALSGSLIAVFWIPR